MGLRRVDSNMGTEPNRNTEFIDQRGFWIAYPLCILAARLALGVFLHLTHLAPLYFVWSFTHILHTAVSFYIIHWVRGTPFSTTYEQGKYDTDTFWEQIDAGRQFTTNKKLFTTIPVILFLLAAYDMEWEHHSAMLIIDVVALGFGVIPKLPALDHVRIFGINKD